MHSKPNLISLCGIADDATEADLSGLGMDADDAIILASELPDKEAMTRLNLSNNVLLTQKGGRALGNMLKANAILKELDVSDSGNGMYDHQKNGPGFAIAISEGLAGNGAILQFTFSGDSYDSTPVTMNTSMVEANFGGKDLGISGAIMVAAFLPKCT
jgi:hypothetical protein